jgi:hypothetical protein
MTEVESLGLVTPVWGYWVISRGPRPCFNLPAKTGIEIMGVIFFETLSIRWGLVRRDQ